MQSDFNASINMQSYCFYAVNGYKLFSNLLGLVIRMK